MALSDHVNTFGRYLRERYPERVHKLCVSVGFTCPNMDGSRGRGGCTFCNNASFTPQGFDGGEVASQIAAGREVVRRRTGARHYIAYFQAYTNTYADVERLRRLYDEALAQPGVIGLSIGTRPDCVPDEVLDLLLAYRDQGHEVWLELGLQSASDATLRRVNRGHGLSEYVDAVTRARKRRLPVCTHLIAGLPGESPEQVRKTVECVVDHGVDGLKLHPLHVVRGTQLAQEWRRGAYTPWSMETYVATAAEMVRAVPAEIVWHRLTATARQPLLLAPQWCSAKWRVLNAIETALAQQAAGHGGG